MHLIEKKTQPLVTVSISIHNCLEWRQYVASTSCWNALKLSGFMRGKMFGSGHTQTAMFLLEDDNVAETGFGSQEWEQN